MHVSHWKWSAMYRGVGHTAAQASSAMRKMTETRREMTGILLSTDVVYQVLGLVG